MTYNTLSANTLEDQLPLSSKQALRDSSGSLKERTEEPPGSLNKVYRAHFAWPTLYCVCACASMHEDRGQTCPSERQSGVHQGVAPPGLTHLTYRWEREQVRGAREERCYALVCMSNHPDLTANHLQSF